jgi:hypothetical protein
VITDRSCLNDQVGDFSSKRERFFFKKREILELAIRRKF